MGVVQAVARGAAKCVALAGFALSITILAAGSPRAEEQTVEILAVHFPPYEYEKPENGLRGFDVEVTEAAFARQGIEATFKFLPWGRVVDLNKKGEALAALTCAYRKDREEFWAFSDTISAATRGFFSLERRDVANIGVIPDGKPYKVGAVLGYSTVKELRDAGIEPDLSPTDDVALKKLRDQRIDLFFTSKESGQLIAKDIFPKGTLKFQETAAKLYYLCFSKKYPGSERLRKLFNKGLAEIKADGTYDAIHDRYR